MEMNILSFNLLMRMHVIGRYGESWEQVVQLGSFHVHMSPCPGVYIVETLPLVTSSMYCTIS